jgi:hypothetical protein
MGRRVDDLYLGTNIKHDRSLRGKTQTEGELLAGLFFSISGEASGRPPGVEPQIGRAGGPQRAVNSLKCNTEGDSHETPYDYGHPIPWDCCTVFTGFR